MNRHQTGAVPIDLDGAPPPGPPLLRVCYVALATMGLARLVDRAGALRDWHGWDVTCVTGGPEGPLHAALRAARIPYRVVDVDEHMLPSPWALIPRVLALAAYFRRERFDVVDTSLWQSLLVGRLAGWLADVPVRAAFVMGPFHLDAPISRWIDAATCWMETRILASCECIREEYGALGVPADRLALVSTGVDETRFDPDNVVARDLLQEFGLPAGTRVVGHVAWFYPRLDVSRWTPPPCRGRAAKGHDDLIRALPHVLRECPDARVVLIGGAWGEQGARYMQEMRALVDEHGLQEHVVFAGARSDVANVYAAIDVAVHPSLTEACGGTMESLLMARPTVATRVGGMPDLVIDGRTGVLVNPSDPGDLARGILELLRDRDRARALAEAGRARALTVATLRKAVSDRNTIYREALFENGRPRSGYRLGVSLARLPVVVVVAIALYVRYVVVERYYLPKWEAGWRPWRLGALAVLMFELPAVLAAALVPPAWLAGVRGALRR